MKQCQSCGMPLYSKKAGDCRGTERGGGRSEKWCGLCYADGRFVKPDCTLDEMIKIVDEALKREKVHSPVRFMARRQIPSLERWR